jgi:hypothetical protein
MSDKQQLFRFVTAKPTLLTSETKKTSLDLRSPFLLSSKRWRKKNRKEREAEVEFFLVWKEKLGE